MALFQQQNSTTGPTNFYNPAQEQFIIIPPAFNMHHSEVSVPCSTYKSQNCINQAAKFRVSYYCILNTGRVMRSDKEWYGNFSPNVPVAKRLVYQIVGECPKQYALCIRTFIGVKPLKYVCTRTHSAQIICAFQHTFSLVLNID